MSYHNRISFLEETHRRLDKQIKLLEECKGPAEDITHLKKKKLDIKDEISRLNRLQFESERETVHWDEDR
jgi:hypothetical protein